MTFRNTSKGNLHLGEFHIIHPNKDVELDADDLHRPLIKKAINLGWLTQILKDVVETITPTVEQDIVQDVVSDIVHPKDSELNAVQKKAIEEATARAASEKKTWNPVNYMFDSEKDGSTDLLNTPSAVDTTTQYGNAETAYDAEKQFLVHTGGTGLESAQPLASHPQDVMPPKAAAPEKPKTEKPVAKPATKLATKPVKKATPKKPTT